MQTIGKMDDGRVLALLTQAECRAMEAVQMAAAGILEEMSNVMNPATVAASPGTPVTSDAEIQSALRIPGKEGTPAEPIALGATQIRPISPKRRRASTATIKPVAIKKSRLCVWCEKPLGKGYGPLAKTHTGECKKKYLAKKARDAWREKHHVKNPRRDLEKPSAQTINPADPFLTDEQRNEMMARREKLIAESARRHADG